MNVVAPSPATVLRLFEPPRPPLYRNLRSAQRQGAPVGTVCGMSSNIVLTQLVENVDRILPMLDSRD